MLKQIKKPRTRTEFSEAIQQFLEETKKIQKTLGELTIFEAYLSRCLRIIFEFNYPILITFKLKENAGVNFSTKRKWMHASQFPDRCITGQLLYVIRYERRLHEYKIILTKLDGFKNANLKASVNVNQVASVERVKLGNAKIKDPIGIEVVNRHKLNEFDLKNLWK